MLSLHWWAEWTEHGMAGSLPMCSVHLTLIQASRFGVKGYSSKQYGVRRTDVRSYYITVEWLVKKLRRARQYARIWLVLFSGTTREAVALIPNHWLVELFAVENIATSFF